LESGHDLFIIGHGLGASNGSGRVSWQKWQSQRSWVSHTDQLLVVAFWDNDVEVSE
jgi:hypothetical protein